jgi:hypothetical protein
MEQQSVAGGVFLLALLNAWLASRRERSAAKWFMGTILLAPFAPLMTLYLLMHPKEPGRSGTLNPVWDWIKLLGLAAAIVVIVFAALVNITGQPPGGAIATSQPQPMQAP